MNRPIKNNCLIECPYCKSPELELRTAKLDGKLDIYYVCNKCSEEWELIDKDSKY